MSTGKKPTRLTRAVAIRDHLLPLIHKHGRSQPKEGGKLRWTEWDPPMFNVVLNTPFTPLPADSGRGSFERALLRQRTGTVLPWRLDIWHAAAGKVMSLQWDNGGTVEIISFRSGAWEVDALALR